MSLEFSSKPNYFFFAQTFINHLKDQLIRQPADTVNLSLADIHGWFRGDFAATTANLEGILNIADSYRVVTGNQATQLIEHYHINAETNSVTLQLNSAAAQALSQGAELVIPEDSEY